MHMEGFLPANKASRPKGKHRIATTHTHPGFPANLVNLLQYGHLETDIIKPFP